MSPLPRIRFLSAVCLGCFCWSPVVANPYPTDVVLWGAGQVLTNAVRSAVASDDHALFLQSDGHIVSTGSSFAMRSIPSGAQNALQVVVGDGACAALRADGKVEVWGSDTITVKRLSPPADLGRVKRLAMGYQFLLALLEDSTLRTWGMQPTWVDSIARLQRKVVTIAAAPLNSISSKIFLAVVGDTLKSIRTNVSSVVVDKTYLGQGIVDIQVGRSSALVLTKNGTVKSSFGGSRDTVPKNLGKVLAIAAGPDHSLAIRPDSTVAAWGTTNLIWSDSLLDPRRIPVALRKVVAIAAGMETSIAIKADGSVVVWGDTTRHFKPPQKEKVDVVDIESKSPTPVMRFADGGAEAWSTTTRMTIHDTLLPAEALSSHLGVAMSRRMDGTIRSWNDYTKSPYFPADTSRYVDMALGGSAILAVKQDGTLAVLLKSGSGCSGCDLPPLGLGKVKKVDVASNLTAVIKADGTPYIWGDTASTQLSPPAGLSDLVDIRITREAALAMTSNGSVVAWGRDTSITNIPPDALLDIRSISLSTCAMALRKDGRVVSWGKSKNPDCRIPWDLGPVKAISAGHLFNSALLENQASSTSPGANRADRPSLLAGSYPAALFDLRGAKLWQGSAEWTGTRWILPLSPKGTNFLQAKTPYGLRTSPIAILR